MTIKEFFKKKATILTIATVFLLIFAFVFFGDNGDEDGSQIITVETRDLKQEVSVTGTVSPMQNVELSFENSGRVQKVYVKSGDIVKKGQILAELENGNLRAQVARANAGLQAENARLKQYQASYDAEAARLAELLNGASTEEIATYEVAVSNAKAGLINAQNTLGNAEEKAEIDLQNVYNGVQDVIEDAYFYADDATRVQTDALFNNDSVDPELTFTVTDYEDEHGAERSRLLAEEAIQDFKVEIDSLSLSTSDGATLDTALSNALNYMETVRDFLDWVSSALNHSAGLSDSTLASYKADVNTARANVNTAIESINNKIQGIATQKITNSTNIQTAQTALTTAENSLATAEANLALTKAGATKEEIAEEEANLASAEANLEMQEAGVLSAKADLAQYSANLNKTIIYAPFDGIITKLDAKEGESETALTPLVSMMSSGTFEVEAYVAEADISKVATDMSAGITLDAYGSDLVFPAKIVFVEMAETVIDGVSTYKIKLHFDEESEKIRSGMTANIDIFGESKTSVLAIPQRSIIRKDEKKYVQVVNEDGTITEVLIETGFRGSDGYTEVTSGLSSGDKILLYGAD